MKPTIEDLYAYKTRLEGDVRRSRHIDPDGLTRNTPLIRNLEQVNRDIANFEPTTTTEVL